MTRSRIPHTNAGAQTVLVLGGPLDGLHLDRRALINVPMVEGERLEYSIASEPLPSTPGGRIERGTEVWSVWVARHVRSGPHEVTHERLRDEIAKGLHHRSDVL